MESPALLPQCVLGTKSGQVVEETQPPTYGYNVPLGVSFHNNYQVE
eukprot:SAG11_NODE_733_length_7467_cov_4.673453_1_plen_46_part_00